MSQSSATVSAIPHTRSAPESRGILSTAEWTVSKGYFALFIFVIARFWLLPLRDGFWLDETGTVWAIQGRLRDVLARCDIWPSQSPAYSLIVWFFYRLPGPHEVMVRLPSLIAMCVAAYFLYRLAFRVCGPAAAWPSVIAFALIEPVAFAAADARPYAIAMLAVVGAIFLLVRWFDTGRYLYGLGYCLLASLSVYMHFVFGVTFLIHVVYGIYRVRTEKRVTAIQLCLAALIIGVLLLPATFHLIAVLKTGHSMSFAGTPTGNDLYTMLAPPVFVGSVLWVLLLAHLAKRRFEFRLKELNTASLVLLMSWVLVPVGLLAGVSTMTNLKLFLPRYLLPADAGLALLAGWALSSISPKWMRDVAVAGLVLSVLAVSPSARFSHGGDWRAALGAVNSTNDKAQMPVLVRSGFVESDPFNWQADRTRSTYLFAPLAVYPLASEQVVRLPSQLSPSSIAYLNTFALERGNGFLLVNMGDASYQNFLLGKLSAEGFQKKRIGAFGGSLTVDEFFRANPLKK
jgi:hypothetical protein